MGGGNDDGTRMEKSLSKKNKEVSVYNSNKRCWSRTSESEQQARGKKGHLHMEKGWIDEQMISGDRISVSSPIDEAVPSVCKKIKQFRIHPGWIRSKVEISRAKIFGVRLRSPRGSAGCTSRPHQEAFSLQFPFLPQLPLHQSPTDSKIHHSRAFRNCTLP